MIKFNMVQDLESFYKALDKVDGLHSIHKDFQDIHILVLNTLILYMMLAQRLQALEKLKQKT